jgi:hypothetical protein
MPNLTTISDSYRIQYANSFELADQQIDTRLVDTVVVKPQMGASLRENLISPTTWSTKGARGTATVNTDVIMPVRWGFFTQFAHSFCMDEFDEINLGMQVSPTGDLIQDQTAGYNRLRDDVIIGAALNAATQSTATATNGGIPTTTSIPFDTTNQLIKADRVPFGGTNVTSGLTLDKVKYTKFKFDKAEVSAADRYFVISAAEIQDLLSTTEISNALYNQVKALVKGDIDSFLGFKFIHSERLPVITSTTNTAGTTITGNFRQCIAYSKRALVFSESPKEFHMDILPMQQHDLQCRAAVSASALRRLDTGVVQIQTDTSKQ